MRNSPAILLLMAITLIGAMFLFPGCTPEGAQQEPQMEEAPPEPEAAEEPEPDAEEDDAADAPAAEGEAVLERPERELSEQQAEAALDIEVDLNRAYAQGAFEPIRTVLHVGTAQQQQQARAMLEKLLLQSNILTTRAQAAGVLAVNPEGSEDALTDAALNDPEKLVRRQAIDALAKAEQSPELLAALAKAQDADDPEVRSAALTAEMQVRLNALDQTTDTAWMARLLGREKDDASAQLQMMLVQKGNPALPAIINVLQTASDPDARAGAATAIACICAGTNPKQQEFAEYSQAMMKETLKKPGPVNLKGLKPLERALADDQSWKVRAIAAQGLGYLGQESSAKLLGEALHDEYEEVRWWSALALETVPSIDALDDLAHAATRDTSRRVRAAAVEALGWVGDDEAVMPLIRATADSSAAVRQAAAQQLARYEAPASLQALVALFDDESEDVRWAAVVAAGDLREEETVPDLIEAMRDPSPMVANAAERALQRMGKAERRFGLETEG